MLAKKNLIHNDQLGMITGVIRSKDVEYLSRVADEDWKGNAIVYSHIGGTLDFIICLSFSHD